MAVKDTIELGLSDGINWKDISDKPIGNESNQINSNGVIEHINANTIRSGTITGTKIQTSPDGARVVIGGVGEDANDITLVDDTTGPNIENGDPYVLTGNTASINMTRSDDYTHNFTINRRTSALNDDHNVVEMFFDKAADGDGDNYLFLGTAGDLTSHTTDRLWMSAGKYALIAVKNSQDLPLDTFAVYSSYALPTMVDEGASRVDISYLEADTPAPIDFTDPNAPEGGGGIMFHRANPIAYAAAPTTYKQDTLACFDQGGFKLFSDDGTQSGYLTVNDSTGDLEWNGVAIS